MPSWNALRNTWTNLVLQWHREQPRNASVTNRMAVLLISPDYALRESLAALSLVNGWDVYWADSGGDAVRILTRRPIPLVICDEEATGSWRNIVEQIAFLPRSTCVLLISRFCDAALRAEAVRCHAYDVIAKPLNWDEVTGYAQFTWAWYTSGMGSWWTPAAAGSAADGR